MKRFESDNFSISLKHVIHSFIFTLKPISLSDMSFSFLYAIKTEQSVVYEILAGDAKSLLSVFRPLSQGNQIASLICLFLFFIRYRLDVKCVLTKE